MACCGQSSPLNRPPVPPKSYRTTGLNPQAGQLGSPGFAQPLPAQGSPTPVAAQPAAPKRTQV